MFVCFVLSLLVLSTVAYDLGHRREPKVLS